MLKGYLVSLGPSRVSKHSHCALAGHGAAANAVSLPEHNSHEEETRLEQNVQIQGRGSTLLKVTSFQNYSSHSLALCLFHLQRSHSNMITSYIWLVLFIGLILFFTNRHLIASKRPQLKANGQAIIEAIQYTYEIEEVELKKSVKHQDDHNPTLLIRLLFNSSLPTADLLSDTAAIIAAQIKEALQHPEDFQTFKLYFINKQENQKHTRENIALFEFNVSSIGTS